MPTPHLLILAPPTPHTLFPTPHPSGASVNQSVVEANLSFAKAYKEFVADKDPKKPGKFTGNKKFMPEFQSSYFLEQALRLQSQVTNSTIGRVYRK